MAEIERRIPSVAIIDHVGLKAGMECYDLELHKALSEAGWFPLIYSNFPETTDEHGIFPVFSFRISENIFSLMNMFRMYRALRKEITSKKIPHCILHGFRFGFAEWMMIKNIALSGTRIYLIVHDAESLLGKNADKKWMNRIFSVCKRLIVHNRFSYNEVLQMLSSGDKKKLLVIPHGNFIHSAVHPADKATEEPLNIDRKKKYVLFFGQIKPTKGLDLLLEAFSRIDDTAELIIAGRIRHHSFKVYQEIIDRHKLHDRVKLFIGYNSPAMRNFLFQLADVVVLPYKKVFQSGVMLMAMSYKKAVIASDLEPNREIIADRQNGILFATGDSDDLSEKLNDVLSNNVLREKIADAGFQYVKQQHDWYKIAREWVRVFES